MKVDRDILIIFLKGTWTFYEILLIFTSYTLRCINKGINFSKLFAKKPNSKQNKKPIRNKLNQTTEILTGVDFSDYNLF